MPDSEKGLAILEAFDDQHARMTPTQAAARTGLTRTAARRYLLTLAHLGYVQTDGKLFNLTPRVLRMGWSYFESARLPRIVQPYLQQLSALIHESVYVSVLDDWDLVIIARNGSTRVMTTGFVLGARVPAALMSGGIAMLAYMDEESVRGWLDATEFKPFTPLTITDKEKLYEKIRQARVDGYRLDRAAIADGRARYRRADEEPARQSGRGVVGEHADRQGDGRDGARPRAAAVAGDGVVDVERDLAGPESQQR